MEGIVKQVPQEPDLLQRAILRVKQRVMPNFKADPSTFAFEPYKQLYKALQIFDIPDTETDKRVKFIWDFLSEDGRDPRDRLVKLHTKLGRVGFGETLLDKVYRYCRLHNEARRALGQYRNIERDMNALSKRG